MELSEERHGDILLIKIHEDRIDAAAAVTFKDGVRSLIANHPGRVVLDLSQVEFLDSSGLGSLVAVMKMLGGRKLEVAGSRDIVLRVLSLTKMDRVFVLHPDRDAALKGLDAA
ncbi:STAS domain-containing protein [Jannaschia aquimarina]|uniref:Anti-sigma factor antagonist n=1 Tax=Jannaschia aquimarina TaxID=935700 RepID=A0A0D1ED75_9RHOB|nr:STAS domain-containing protein [Jannaschia aquimarina]KIT15669.1 putative anti-sigma factor antagonist [Jannaschia aquimarina]SNT39359.1 anti-sigma B factor antagonist [Jannaschia aquimarina]